MTSEQIAWYWTGFIAFWFLFAWWVASTWHLGRMATYERSHSLGAWAVVASFLAVFVLPSQELFTSYSSPGYSGGLYDFVVRVTANQEEHRVNHAYVPPEIDVEGTFYRQPTLIDAATRTLAPSRPEKSEIYYVGVAPFASEGVFKNEIIAVRNLLEQRFDANGRSIVLVNHKRTLDRFALANLTNLDAVMQRVGEVMVPEKDVLVLFISSHGLKERISVQFPLFQMNEITANRLAEVLARSKIKNRVIVISACYSGSFIPKLRDANSLIMTAASSDTVSFGCSNDATWTYFGDALFNRALRGTFSFARAFGEAKATIEKWEKEQMLPASEPQIYVGSSIGPVLDRLEEQLEQRNLSAPPPTASENAARASLELGTTLEPGKSSQATATP